jgi:hypothetical protein
MGPSFGHQFAVQDHGLENANAPPGSSSMRMILSENRSYPRIESEGMLFGIMRHAP